MDRLSSPTLLDADLEAYTFAAFADGNFLLSGVQRDVQTRKIAGATFTAVFSADGRELAQLSFQESQAHGKAAAKSDARTKMLRRRRPRLIWRMPRPETTATSMSCERLLPRWSM